jgi:hypothetical protein
MENNFLLMTAHHKNDPFLEISKKYFFPIQVGKALSDLDLNVNKDDKLDNISIKNRTFCELTAYYSAWKNYQAEYIGLMHYRRIFTEKNFLFNKTISKLKYHLKSLLYCYECKDPNHHFSNMIYIKTKRDADLISKSLNNYFKKKLHNYDIVLPKKNSYKYLNLEQQFILSHNTDDWLLFKKIINEDYPFLKNSTRIVSKAKRFYAYNMFIMKKELFSDYMEVLFSILFKMENLVDLTNKTPYQARIFGFISERFLNIYVHYLISEKKIRVKELNTVFLDLEQ